MMGLTHAADLLLNAVLKRQTMVLTESEDLLVVEICVTGVLLLTCMTVGHLLHANRWVNESITALILGLATGIVIFFISKGKSSHVLQFDEDIFFFYLLPPIIFNAGFQMKKKQFFQNFVAIVLFGVIGVFISFAVITLGCKIILPRLGLSLDYSDYMALGIIFSATDSVCTLQVLHQDETPLLYSLVFGEGVINDATSVVLFNAVQDLDISDIDAERILVLIAEFLYLFLTSTLLGIGAGLLSAFIIKKLYFGRHSTDREIAIMMFMPYLSYMLCELLDLSGILAVFFCGIVMSHYTWHNITESSRVTTRHAFATMSFTAETFIFLYVGMDALDKDKWKMTNVGSSFSAAISATILLLVLLGRAAFVVPMSCLANYIGKRPNTRITFHHQVIIWWAGLMRGAVSIALAYNQFTESGSTNSPIHATVITSTIIVVLFSTVVFGILTKPLVEWILPTHLRLPNDCSSPSSPKDDAGSDGPFLDGNGPLADSVPSRSGSLYMLLTASTSTVHYYWRKFDDRYMRPIFGGRGIDIIPPSIIEDS